MKIELIVILMLVLIYLIIDSIITYRKDKRHKKELREMIIQVKRMEEKLIKLNNRYRNGD
jgi:preprotein translocase subunit YajC